MNSKLLIAFAAYIMTSAVLNAILGQFLSERLFYLLFFSQTSALLISWVLYWALQPPKYRPHLPKSGGAMAGTVCRLVIAGIVTFGSLLGIIRSFYSSEYVQSGTGLGILFVGVVFFAVPLLLPMLFWGIYLLAGRFFNWQFRPAARQKDMTIQALVKTLFIIINFMLMPVNIFAIFAMTIAPLAGMIVMALWPLFVIAALLLVVDAIYFLVKAFKHNTQPRKRVLYLLGTLVCLAPIVYYLLISLNYNNNLL